MANDIDIKVGVVGSQDILKLTKNIEGTSANVRKLSAAFQSGKITNQAYFTGINQQIPALRKLGLSYKEAQAKVWEYARAQQSAAAITQVATRKLNGSGVAIQQLGYQVGDFAVQVQSGTNGFVAFGQQATQLVGVLPLIHRQLGISAMAAVGFATGLGIIIPILTGIGAYFSRSAKSVDTFTEAMKSSGEAITDVKDRIAMLNMGLKEKAQLELINSVAQINSQIIAQQELLNNADVESYGIYAEKLAALEKQKTSLEAQKKELDALLSTEEDIKSSKENQKKVLDQIAEIEELLAQKTGALRIKNQDEYLARLAIENAERIKMEENVARYANSRTIDAQNQANAARKLADEVGKAYLDAIGLGKANVDSGINKAAEAARVLAERMNISLKAARGMISLAYSPKDYSNLNYGGARADARMAGSSTPPVIRDSRITSGGGGGVAGKIDTQEEYLAKLAREYDMKKKSLGLTDQQVKRNEFLFTLDEKIATMKTQRSELEIETERQKAIAAYDAFVAAEKQAAVMGIVTSSLETMFMSFVDGTKSVGDAFKGMLRDIVMQIYQDRVAKQAAEGIGNFISGLFMANGGAFSGGSQITAYANGGVVGSPTMFKHSGGLGLMGEAGPEAIMPLKRGANGKLGVQVDGSQGNVVVNQTFNFSANGDDSVKKIIAQAAPQIAQMTQQKIMDSRRRGGSMKAAFG